jgi:hypothetical protein
MTDGRGYQYVGGTMLPLEETPQPITDQGLGAGVSPGVVPAQVAAPAPAPVAAPPPPLAPTATRPATKVGRLTTRNIVVLARRRIREIRAELKHHEKLKTELKELVRLVDAAKGKSPAQVRALRPANRAG